MTTTAAGLAGTPPASTRAPYHCAACGEPLYTRALACPHCGAPDPVAAADAPDPVVAPEAHAPAVEPEISAPEGRTPAVEPEAAAPVPVAAPDETLAADDLEVAPDEVVYAELEPVADEPAHPHVPRPPAGSSRLDISPEPFDDDVSDSRDLVLVPERGGRTMMIPEPRRRGGRMLGVGLVALLLVGVAAGGLLGWRMLSGPPAAAEQTVTADTGWTAVELAAGDGTGEWVVTAEAPFRIRVDGAVYTVGGPAGVAIPLDGRSVAVRAISGSTNITFVRR